MLDLEAAKVDGAFKRIKISLLDAAMELQDVEMTRCLSAVSIPLVHLPNCVAGLSELCELSGASWFLGGYLIISDAIRSVSDMHLAEIACASSRRDSVAGMQSYGHSFATFSASGAIHAPHFDPNGMGTLLHVHEGFVFFVVGEYKGGLASLPPLPSPNGKEGLWSIFDIEGLSLSSFVLGPQDAV